MDNAKLEGFRRVLKYHAEKYPLMQPADAVKLAFQSEFGCEHLVKDSEGLFEYLERECDRVSQDTSAPLFEEIGDGMVRVMLGARSEENYPLKMLYNDFVRSANNHVGLKSDFYDKLKTASELSSEGMFGFSRDEFDRYISGYIERGISPISHSDVYRSAYRPAYRVIQSRFSLPFLVEKIIEQSKTQRVIAAIDGRCASGKTSLAEMLHSKYGWSVVHIDDFFLRPEQRTPERYNLAGENIDHERFLKEVLIPLKETGSAEYRRFDCHTMSLADTVRVGGNVVIIEGTYSCHRELRDYYDFRVFLDVSPETQRERISKRNGAEMFYKLWIPLEEKYFSECRVRCACEYWIELA